MIIPGGIGTRAEAGNARVVNWVVACAQHAEVVLSVCSGARILARSGLLDGLEATTHHQVIAELRQLAPTAIVRENVRFVDNGKVMTAAGISAGIDLSLHVVRKLLGAETATKTARYMEYETGCMAGSVSVPQDRDRAVRQASSWR